jgi:hypothetical protein
MWHKMPEIMWTLVRAQMFFAVISVLCSNDGLMILWLMSECLVYRMAQVRAG